MTLKKAKEIQEKIYRRGYEDYLAGKSYDSYEGKELRRPIWLDGWKQAKRDTNSQKGKE